MGTAKRVAERGRWEQKKWIIQVREEETAQKKRKRSQGGASEAGGGKGNGRNWVRHGENKGRSWEAEGWQGRMNPDASLIFGTS